MTSLFTVPPDLTIPPWLRRTPSTRTQLPHTSASSPTYQVPPELAWCTPGALESAQRDLTRCGYRLEDWVVALSELSLAAQESYRQDILNTKARAHWLMEQSYREFLEQEIVRVAARQTAKQQEKLATREERKVNKPPTIRSTLVSLRKIVKGMSVGREKRVRRRYGMAAISEDSELSLQRGLFKPEQVPRVIAVIEAWLAREAPKGKKRRSPMKKCV